MNPSQLSSFFKRVLLCIILMKINLVIGLENDSNEFSIRNGYNNCDFFTNGERWFLSKHLNYKVSTIFDVGANVGEWSAIAAEFAPNATIYAFEPHPEIFELLKLRSLRKKVVCHQLALSNKKKEVDLWVWGNDRNIEKSGLNGLYYRPILKTAFKVEPNRIKINAVTLDEFCQKNKVGHIDLLKIDTEGSELDILLGAEKMISNGCIDLIQFEYGGCYQDSQTKLESVYRLLVKNSYDIFRILPNMLLAIPIWDAKLENFQYSNYVAIRRK